MKNKTYRIIVLITLAAMLLTACAGNTALGAESATAEPTTGQPHVENVQPTENESVQTTPPVEMEAATPIEAEESSEETSRPTGWSDETHSKEASPNYEVVFPQDEVNRLDITISPDNWQAMLADMTSLYGEFGANPRGPGAGQGEPREQNQPAFDGQLPIEGQPPEDLHPPAGGQAPKNGEQLAGGNRKPGGGARMEGDSHNPTWIPVTIEFEGDTWTNVGLRFKGNSSLFSSWGSGNYKLPMKLDFDEFEDNHPEIDDQRFYGFKQLSLSSNFQDNSFLREKVAADIFREAGVPAAQTAFYQVYIDYGAGPVYFGLYTMVEIVDDTVIETQFEDDSGNVYKPSGTGATFAAGSFSEASFDKETNQDEADYSDILALYQALHAETRTSAPETWRADLEAVFDVDGFLNWLAVNTVIQNWDTYGSMQHNYYLYRDPTTDLLTWIPWDNNEAFKDGNMRGSVSLSLDEVTDEWPLIRYLMDDPVYQAKYTAYVETLISGAFNPDIISARYQELHEMIRLYVVGAEGEIDGYTHLQSDQAFEAALDELIRHAQNRYQAASEYLDSLR
jgi:spore coat protein H